MRTPTSCASALAALLALAAPAANGDDIPLDNIALEMRPIDADVLFKKYSYDKSSFAVTIVEPDGTRLPGRVEVKGKSSRLVPKKGPLIKLDKPGRWRGNSRVSMNALATDPTMMREWLAWDLIHRLGMVSPEVGYTFVKINGEDKGLFLRIEWFGPQMFERYGHKSGALYDPEDTESCGDLSVESLERLDECWVKLFPDGNLAPLVDLIKQVEAESPDTFDRFMERNFDVESVINWIAVTVVTSNLTTYNNEYWPYFSDTQKKWLVVPWDYDRTFGKNADPWQPYPGFVFNSNFQYYYPLELGASNAVRDKMFKNAALNRRIVERIREIVEGAPDPRRPWSGWFAPSAMEARIDRLYKFVQPLRARDPFQVGLDATFEEEVAALRHYVRARSNYLRQAVFNEGRGSLPGEGSANVSGGTAYVTDGAGRVVAWVSPVGGGAGTVRASALAGPPEMMPPGVDRTACVQRGWQVAAPAGEADVLVEYLQEFQRTSEVGRDVTSEAELALYARDGRGWWRLPTTVNPLANTLRARVRFGAQPLRLVACDPTPAGQTAAR